jgi:hypothetical protein
LEINDVAKAWSFFGFCPLGSGNSPLHRLPQPAAFRAPLSASTGHQGYGKIHSVPTTHRYFYFLYQQKRREKEARVPIYILANYGLMAPLEHEVKSNMPITNVATE